MATGDGRGLSFLFELQGTIAKKAFQGNL